jgi:hypothetical protein
MSANGLASPGSNRCVRPVDVLLYVMFLHTLLTYDLFRYSDSPLSMAALVNKVVEHICEQEEQDRLRALEAMLLGGQKTRKSPSIGVTKDYPPELKLTENSRLHLCA